MSNSEMLGEEAGVACGSAGEVRLDLPSDASFGAARALHEAFLAAREAKTVVLDASKVERMSTAAVLVLVSFLNARADVTPPASILSPSGAFVDAFSELGLFSSLMRMEFRA